MNDLLQFKGKILQDSELSIGQIVWCETDVIFRNKNIPLEGIPGKIIYRDLYRNKDDSYGYLIKVKLNNDKEINSHILLPSICFFFEYNNK
jgi:hypothetical protein